MKKSPFIGKKPPFIGKIGKNGHLTSHVTLSLKTANLHRPTVCQKYTKTKDFQMGPKPKHGTHLPTKKIYLKSRKDDLKKLKGHLLTKKDISKRHIYKQKNFFVKVG